MPIVEDHKDGLVIQVRVQPRSAKNQIAGRHGDALKLKLTAPPVEGEANRQCIAFLAKALDLPKSDLEIVSGKSARDKRILVRLASGADPSALRKAVETLLNF